MNIGHREVSNEEIFFNLLSMIENENPLYFALDNNIAEQGIKHGLYEWREKQSNELKFQHLKITDKGLKLMSRWRALNN